MVTWGVTDAGVGSRGGRSAYLIEATGWNGGSDAGRLPSLDGGRLDRSGTVRERLGGTVSGTTTGLTIPATAASCHGSIAAGERRSLGEGTHRLVAKVPGDAPVGDGRATVTVQFRGAATVSRESDTVRVSFPSRTTVAIEVTDPSVEPERITVPASPSGLARGLSALGATHQTASPARSHPARRRHPPLLSVGETFSTPECLDGADRRDAPVELTLPDAYDPLFVAAPLAYYLGAKVRVADIERPRLQVPSEGIDRRLPALPGFQEAAASLCRQVFYLDCLVRNADDHTVSPVLSDAGLDAERLRDAGVAERLAQYLSVAGEDLAARLPEWHLSTYVSPDPEHVSALPYLLDDMSLLYLPSASELSDRDLLDRALSDDYRAATPEVPSVDVLEPDLRSGAVHAWLAEGTPVDAYKTTTSAFRNRRRYRERPPGPFTVTVVLNDDEMDAEHEAVADIYRRRATDLPIEVDVRERLTTDELAAAFERPTDFLHYIGHCEPDGLTCPDGTLAAADLDTSRTRTFFLNACGSYHEGIDLVERGSLAGAVTLTAVLDEQAATVGTAFARLIMHGFSIERAMDLARRRVFMSKDYAVVGDGTDSLVPAPGEPAVVYLEDDGADYTVTVERVRDGRNGRHADVSPDGSDSTPRTLPADQLRPLLESTSLPVIYDGQFHWSSDLSSRI